MASTSATAGSSANATPTDGPARAGQWPPAVVDLHTDTPWQVRYKKRSEALTEGHITPQTLRDGRYAGIVFVLYVPDVAKKPPTVADETAALETASRLVDRHELLRWALPPQGGRVAVGAGAEVDVFLSIEGAEAFADEPSAIDGFIAKGVRLVGLVHSRDNSLATTAGSTKQEGLSQRGKELARRVYGLGALVDVSHMSDASFWELSELAKQVGAPIVASHSNSRALCDVPRNLTDDQLRAIGDSGGVAGLNTHHKFVRKGKARLEHLVDHALHMVKVAGIEHVAIGTDFDGGKPIKGLDDASKLPALAEALRAKGLSEADVAKLFSANALRVLGWQPPKGAK